MKIDIPDDVPNEAPPQAAGTGGKWPRFGRPIEEGFYEGEVIKWEEKTAAASGNSRIEFVFGIQGDDTTTPEGPVKLSYTMWPPSEGKPSKTFKDVLDLFFRDRHKSRKPITTEDFDSMLGKGCRVLVKPDEFGGQVRMKVVKLYPTKQAKPKTEWHKRIEPDEDKGGPGGDRKPTGASYSDQVPDEDLPF